jgi:prepilin-type N-terminal cleavage/methylation domain-containing protein
MNQKGFTLIELLVALPIGVAILFAVVSSIFQITQGRVDIAEKSTAIADIDNAAHWLTRDLIQAQTTDLVDGADPVSSIATICNDVTAWAAEEGSTEHSASYTRSGTQLLRDYDGEVTVAGRYITNAEFSIEGRLITVTLTSAPDGTAGAIVTRRFSMYMRSDPAP